MLFHLILVFDLLTNSGFEHEADLVVVHFDDLSDDLIGEAMMDHLLLVLPHEHPSFL